MDAGTGAGHDETSAFFATGFSFGEKDAIEESINSMMRIYSARGDCDLGIATSTTTISSADEVFVIALITTNCSVHEDFIAADRSDARTPDQVAGVINAVNKLP
jgi:hypothetical protein